MNALKRGPLSTFKELDPDINVKAPISLDVIFVHGLGARETTGLRKRLKRWLRAARKSVGCRVWRFGFDGKELLTEGRQRLMVLASNLLKDMQRMPGTPTPLLKQEAGSSKRDRKLVFIGYGAAGWVIQEALAWYSNTSTQAARRTAMVILLSLPRIKSKAGLKEYLERFPKLYPGEKKSVLEFAIIEIVQDNFKHLVESSFGPQEKLIEISGVKLGSKTDVRSDPVPRRETHDTTGSSSTDSSKNSGTAPITEKLPLWEIEAGDKTDEEVTSLLRASINLEKSDDMISKPHNVPEYQPIGQKYGRYDAKEFRFPRVPTGLPTKSSNLFPRVASPPTLLEEINDQTPKAVSSRDPHITIEVPAAVENVRAMLETSSLSNSTVSSHASSHAGSESNPERNYIATEMDTTDLDTVTGVDEGLVRQVASPETKIGSNKDLSTPNPPPNTNWGQLLRLAALYQQSGELQKSKALYERLVKVPALKDGIDIIWLQIAITWLYEGRVKRAQEMFSKLEPKVEALYVQQPQRIWEVRRWLAVSLDMRGLYDMGRQKLMAINEAFSSLQQATDVGLLTKSTLALLFGHLGKYEEALNRSKEVLQLAVDAVEKATEKTKKMNGGKGDAAYVTRQRGALGSIQFDRATILTYVGQYDEAETLNNQALENIQKNLGSKHVLTLDCWSLKARHYASTCRLPEAEEQCQKTLKVMRKEIGKEHPSTLKTLGVLVYVYRLQARLTEALDTAKYLFEKCKASDALGENHPETISSMWQLAEVYLARGDFKNALHYQDQVVELADKILGKVHPTVVNYRVCLARIYCNRGSWTHSASLCFDILKDYGSIISEAFQDTRSKPKESEKANDESKSTIQQALDRARHIFIEHNDNFETLNLSLISTMQCLGVTERERLHGNLEVAQEIQTKAHEYMEKELGEDHADTLSSKWDLALTKLKRGQDNALRELEDVTTARRRVLGEDHPDTLAARHHLSLAKFNIYHNLSELAEQAEVLRLCIHLLGEEHPTTNLARIDLSNGYHLVGMIKDAEQLRLKALRVQIKTLPQPELTGAAKSSYEEASQELALHHSTHHGEKRSESEHTGKKRSEPSEPAPTHCHAQVISSLAALALIYVDMAQSADQEALASVQNADPESEKAHQVPISGFNKKAIAAQRAVIEQYQLLCGPSGRETLESINTLGLIYQAAGLADEAISQYILVRNLAHPSSRLHFTSESNLGTLLFAKGDFEAAENIQTQAYRKREIYGEEVIGPKEFAIAVFNLALTKKELGKRKDAPSLMKKALDLSRDAFGYGNPTTERILDTWKEWRDIYGIE